MIPRRIVAAIWTRRHRQTVTSVPSLRPSRLPSPRDPRWTLPWFGPIPARCPGLVLSQVPSCSGASHRCPSPSRTRPRRWETFPGCARHTKTAAAQCVECVPSRGEHFSKRRARLHHERRRNRRGIKLTRIDDCVISDRQRRSIPSEDYSAIIERGFRRRLRPSSTRPSAAYFKQN